MVPSPSTTLLLELQDGICLLAVSRLSKLLNKAHEINKKKLQPCSTRRREHRTNAGLDRSGSSQICGAKTGNQHWQQAMASSLVHLIWQGYNYSKGHKWVSDLQLRFLQEILVVTASVIHTLFRTRKPPSNPERTAPKWLGGLRPPVPIPPPETNSSDPERRNLQI